MKSWVQTFLSVVSEPFNWLSSRLHRSFDELRLLGLPSAWGIWGDHPRGKEAISPVLKPIYLTSLSSVPDSPSTGCLNPLHTLVHLWHIQTPKEKPLFTMHNKNRIHEAISLKRRWLQGLTTNLQMTQSSLWGTYARVMGIMALFVISVYFELGCSRRKNSARNVLNLHRDNF